MTIQNKKKNLNNLLIPLFIITFVGEIEHNILRYGENMKILLSFNDAYAPHAATIVTGLINNNSQKLSVVVLYYCLKAETIEKFVTYYEKRLASIEFIKVEIEPKLAERLMAIRSPMSLQGKIEPWLRLFASSYIQDDYVVWLDCDIVVTGDICKILDEVDNQYLISACKEYDPLYKNNLRDLKQFDKWIFPDKWEGCMIVDAHFYRLYNYYGIPHNVPYFYSGIMYMNLKKWREEEFESQLIKKIWDIDYFFAVDQDVLNSVIKGQFGILSPQWNVMMESTRKCLTNYDFKQIEDSLQSPLIVHLAGGVKPWNENCGGIYRKMYWDYRLDTPWPAKPNWKCRLKNKYSIVNILAKSIGFVKRIISPSHSIVEISFLHEKGRFMSH